MAFDSSVLSEALNIIKENSVDGVDQKTVADEYIFDFVTKCIINPSVDTISIKYDDYQAVIFIATSNQRRVAYFEITEEQYKEFCEQLGVDLTEEYNSSITKNINGIFTRIFALMPPTCELPMITISTTKQPPEIWDQVGVDDILPKVIRENFIIVGKSGAGKTYFFNYLLNKYTNPEWHMAFIEEFGELIPPNNHVMNIRVKPPKPGCESNLKFATEQSNLMRLDRFYIGEVKSSEAWPAVVNLSSGTKGGFTIHGKTWREGLSRLKSLCMTVMPYPEVVNDFIAKAVNYVVLIEDHKVKEIHELTGVSVQGNFQAREVFGGF